MKQLTGQEIRMKWINFFKSKGHMQIPGVNLIPQGDKSLLWVNAGVTGLKKYFDGSVTPPCRRIVNVQKSIRTNDIENVGYTARHHTFFEMLGNFSIGDYFRKEVIEWAVEILTNPETGFGMPIDKIYVTYNPIDLESYELWQKNGIAKDHLVALESNYWEIGEGPCGPNTEVFFDRGEKYDPDHLGIKLLEEDLENDRYIELWGIVFSQFNAEKGKSREEYKELPSKNIDTGCGLERVACILQETETNFETDLFMPIIHATEELSGQKYEGDNLMSFRVIADHARCLTFALGDGANFSNEGRGYVLRRIVRRAMRYGQKLGLTEPFLYKLVDVVTNEYRDFYPNLNETLERTKKQILIEENKFIKTLKTGEVRLTEMLKNKDKLSGEEVFTLYDTYGFPADLTKEIALESGVKVDMEGFEKCMEAQRERARAARGDIVSFNKQSADLMNFKEESEFNYETTILNSKVIALFVDGEQVDEIEQEGYVIVNETPFYAEMGGQVSDTGVIYNKDIVAKVINVVTAPNGQHLHYIKLDEGTVKVGDEITLEVNKIRRDLIARNHSATHLLHASISKVLGNSVAQKGSYVNDEYLRFDFSSNEKLTEQQIENITYAVNLAIKLSIPQKTMVVSIDEAKKLGAEMEFEDKYGDVVRVVCFDDFSKELCGGTHVNNTNEIGLFVIESEEAVSSGVRRIQARTSFGAYDYLKEKINLYDNVKETLGANDQDIIVKINKKDEELKELKLENSKLNDKFSSMEAKNIVNNIETINNVDFLALNKNGSNHDELLRLCDMLKGGRDDYFFFLVGGDEKGHPVVMMSHGKGKELLPAGPTMKKISKEMRGGGGGSPELANGKVKDTSKFDEIASQLKNTLGGK